MNREIPGFYFDPVKKKYFKIQGNHTVPTGAQYSSDSVKRKRAEQEEEQKRERLNQKIVHEKVRKGSFYHHPLIGADREIGSQPLSTSARQEQHASIYVSQMKRRKLYRFEPWSNDYFIKSMVRNPYSGILIAGGHRGPDSAVSLCFPVIEDNQWLYTRGMERALLKDPYRLSSISQSHTGILLATMDSGPNGDSFLAPRMLPAPDEGGDYQWPTNLTHPIRIRTSPSLWCSAACPTGPKALFAVGTSEGLYTLEGFGSHWTLCHKPFPTGETQKFHRKPDSSHANVSAVDWLSSDVIASGLRDSSVFLHDLRSGGSAMRLQHPHAVNKIRRLDPYRLLVAGHNSLEMYDIRYAPNGIQKKPKPTSSSHTSTRPYLNFPQRSSYSILDFDVSSELGLLANASEDRRIQLFSLNTGLEINSPLSRYRYSDNPTCVFFESSNEVLSQHGPQKPSLLVASRARIDQWIW